MTTTEMYIVASDESYEEWVKEFKTREEAEKMFDECSVCKGDNLYLCKVIKKRSVPEILIVMD